MGAVKCDHRTFSFPYYYRAREMSPNAELFTASILYTRGAVDTFHDHSNKYITITTYNYNGTTSL